MTDLVDGVDRYPSQRTLGPLGVIVNYASVPFITAQSVEHMGEHLRSISELAGNVMRILFGVAIMVDSLVAAHRVLRRPIHPPGQQHPLALDQEHIPQVAAVLDGRPRAGLWPGRQLDIASPQDGGDLGDSPDDRLAGLPRFVEVIFEAALLAPVHYGTVAGVTNCGSRAGLDGQ